ncbi:DUF4097 family beta strand repeat-containing protein [Balneolales bacterium ANBcel1]|nr:DUF4097 family beta strand repeat-containing protein [Balneolales bacterium ANBcel1]
MKGRGWFIIAIIALALVIHYSPGFDFQRMVLANGTSGVHANDKPVWHSETVQWEPGMALEAKTSGGSITVEAHSSDDIIVDVYVYRKGAYLEEGKSAPVDFSITQERNRVVVKAETRRTDRWLSWGSSTSVSYRILVPHETELVAQTSGGAVSAKGITQNVSLITSGGSVHAEHIVGDLLARTSGGPITVLHTDGRVTARTSGGGIRMSDVEGSVSARTSGGSIRLTDLSGTISAQTSGGGIHAEILQLEGGLDLATSGGSITAILPNNQGLDIKASGSQVRNRLDDLTGSMQRGSVDGKVKGGGIPVKLRTSGGSVTLEYRSDITELSPRSD